MHACANVPMCTNASFVELDFQVLVLVSSAAKVTGSPTDNLLDDTTKKREVRLMKNRWGVGVCVCVLG